MSFINLLANDVWSEADIVNRTESMVRSEISVAAERILNRKIQGATLGQYTLSVGEQAEIQHFAAVTAAAQQAGEDARAEMAMLKAAMSVEYAERVLASADAQPDAREAAQGVIDDAGTGVLTLVDLRRPAPPETEAGEQERAS